MASVGERESIDLRRKQPPRIHHANGIIRIAAGVPSTIQRRNETSVCASCLSWPMATRLAAVPAGVAMPPMSGPNAVAIMSDRPK